MPAGASQATAATIAERRIGWPAFPALADDLRLVGLRPAQACGPDRANRGGATTVSPIELNGDLAAAAPRSEPFHPDACGLDSFGADPSAADPVRVDPVCLVPVGVDRSGGAEADGGELVLSIQNEGPCRRRLELGAGWQVLQRLDGLDHPWAGEGDSLVLGPWQLAFWRIRRRSIGG
jgi:hypothetical protein